MRVVVDFTGPMSTNTGGTTYSSSLLPRWERCGEDCVTAVFSSGEIPAELASLACVFELQSRRLPGLSPRIIDVHLGLRRLLFERDAAVAYFPGNFVPLGLPAALPVVVAVRSTLHFDMPAQSGRVRGAVQRHASRHVVARAQRIIVPSSKTADALMRHAGARRRQLVVVPHGVDLELFQPGEPAERERDLFVFVSKPWDYKGLHTVFRAMRELRHGPGPTCAPRLLVVDGGLPPSELASWDHLCEKLDISSQVRFAGRLDHHALSRLYRMASALVLPSATESFGNPYLEAAASGSQVILSDDLPLGDILGEAALHVPAHDHVAIATAITRVLTMSAAERCERSQRLRTAAEAFSWDKTLVRTREVLAEVVG